MRRELTGPNEVYLWHGSSPTGVMGIKDTGFRKALAGTGAGSMFGAGIYLAECSSKSDEYATEDAVGAHAGCAALLLCRVLLGECLVLETPDAKRAAHALGKGTHHSVLGDRQKHSGTYREFVTFDQDRVYPEYIVIYKRVKKARRASH